MTIYRTVLLKSIVAGMQLSWIYAIFRVVDYQWVDKSMAFLPLLLCFLISISLSLMFLKQAHQKLRINFISGMSCILFLVLILKISSTDLFDLHWLQTFYLHPFMVIGQYSQELVTIFLGAFMWFMGWWLMKNEIELSYLFTQFQIGFGIIFTAFVVEYYLGIHAIPSFGIVSVFFASGLIGFALLKSYENHVPGSGGSGPGQFIYSAVSVAAIFFLALMIFLVINPKLIELFFELLRYIQEQLMILIDFLMGLISPRERPTLSLNMEGVRGAAAQKATSDLKSSIPGNFREILDLLYALFWVGCFLFTLWRMSNFFLSFLKKKFTSPSQITHASMSGEFKTDLITFVKQLYQSLVKTVKALFGLVLRFIPAHRFFLGPASIEQIYMDVLRWTSSGGYKRMDYQTPYEHSDQLISQFPQTGFGLSYITWLYARQRYGNLCPSPEVQNKMREEWSHLKKIKLRSKNKGK